MVIGSTGQCIRGSKLHTGNMVKFNIKCRKDQLPVSLTTHKLLGSVEIEQILMISKDNNGMRVPFKIVAPLSEHMDYGK
jgi:hypothetical protein